MARFWEKPSDHENACEMIRSIQGRTHQVYTGVTLIYKDQDCDQGVTFVEDRCEGQSHDRRGDYRLRSSQRSLWIKLEPMGSGRVARYAASIQGNYDTVVGLPVSRVYREWKNPDGAGG